MDYKQSLAMSSKPMYPRDLARWSNVLSKVQNSKENYCQLADLNYKYGNWLCTLLHKD